LEFARRARRTRPRPLDWVVGDARLRLRPSAAASPPSEGDDDALRRALVASLSPGLCVLEVCDRQTILAADALSQQHIDYSCLVPIGVRCGESASRPTGCRFVGEPAALIERALKFDLVAWLREREPLRQAVGISEQLLTPKGMLILRTADRFDDSRWNLENAVALPSGSRLLSLRRRGRSAKAA
jgi:hypothetical protein